MIVSELIAALQAFPPGMRVVTNGFDEGGIEDIKVRDVIDVVFNDDEAKRDWHFGRHNEVEDYEKDIEPDEYAKKLAKSQKALHLNF